MGIVFGKTGVVEPAFDVLLSRSSTVPYQLRKYGVRYACETEYPVSAKSDSMGFRALAGYIGVGTTPQNDGGKGIAMTAPVVTEKGGKAIAMTAPVITDTVGNDMKKMAFILPAEYDSMDKIPKPTNPKVKITEIPGANGAVHTFSGSCNDAKAKTTVKALIVQLKNDGVEIDEKVAMEKFELWQFHPPFTIPMMRKNEVWIGLSEDQVNDLMKKYKN
mmetsp:Transcript_13410/g.20135  ORF Transcript_13410/g.20135 Transcript_13410/m.20135 type:complete len:218 (-) Transcript_13410:1398-2051(-)